MPRALSASEVPNVKSPKTQIKKDACAGGKAPSGQAIKLGKADRKFAFAGYSDPEELWARSGGNINTKDRSTEMQRIASTGRVVAKDDFRT